MPKSLFSILFVETSAKTGSNVRSAFEQCVSEIHRRFTSAQESSQSTSATSSARQLLKSRTTGANGSAAGGRRGGVVGPDGHVRLGDGDVGDSEGAVGRCCNVM